MPGVIAISDFVRETREDINSPTTASFVNRIPQCKETVAKLEEVSTADSFIFVKFGGHHIVLIFGTHLEKIV